MKEEPKKQRPQRKRGPVPETLKIDLDPTEGLDRLVGKRPTKPPSEPGSKQRKKPRD
jgi:hypothetical protein